MSIMVAPTGTPLESVEKFKQIGDAFLAIGPVLSGAFVELGKAAAKTATSFDAYFAFTMTRRALRRMHTTFARMNRRPALIHKGGKP